VIYQVEGWRPQGTWSVELGRIEIGSLIAFDYKPYRLIEVRDRAFDLWPENIQAEFHRMNGKDPETWWARVQSMRLQPDGQAAAKGLQRLVRACYSLDVLPEHYAVCHRCGDLPPCRETVMDRQVAEHAAVMDERMAILPGHCLGCGEKITGRMGVHRFLGENLWRPDLGENSAVFHARRACYDQAYRYDEQWAKAQPGRHRRFVCTGDQIRHAEGTLTCTAGDSCPEAGGPTGWTVHHHSFIWHRPGVWTGDGDCWCTAASAVERLEQQMRDGEVQQ
jgi:hypothetical protein